MIGLLKNLRQWSASNRVQPTGTRFERSELGCVASILLPPVPERRSRQPPLLSRRDAQKLGLGGTDRPTRSHSAGRPHRPTTTEASILFSGQIVVPLAAILSEISGNFLTCFPPTLMCRVAR